MNKVSNVLAMVMLGAVLAVSATGCASNCAHESSGEYVDDAAITSKIKTRLVGDEALKAFEIGVETYRGNVQLSGFVDNQDQITKAEEVAKEVPGVKSVKNSLVVKPRNSSAS